MKIELFSPAAERWPTDTQVRKKLYVLLIDIIYALQHSIGTIDVAPERAKTKKTG